MIILWKHYPITLFSPSGLDPLPEFQSPKPKSNFPLKSPGRQKSLSESANINRFKDHSSKNIFINDQNDIFGNNSTGLGSVSKPTVSAIFGPGAVGSQNQGLGRSRSKNSASLSFSKAPGTTGQGQKFGSSRSIFDTDDQPLQVNSGTNVVSSPNFLLSGTSPPAPDQQNTNIIDNLQQKLKEITTKYENATQNYKIELKKRDDRIDALEKRLEEVIGGRS